MRHISYTYANDGMGQAGGLLRTREEAAADLLHVMSLPPISELPRAGMIVRGSQTKGG